ncbi:MAG TPA: ArsC/Spx/MgsR family protein [Methylocystis sp.]|nr:ArsC/Spx/MgsR family protein [Methylocystis sp.]
MARVIFFEKPGCGGNARQKAALAAAGHEVFAKNLLAEPWTEEELLSFFGERPVEQWFNKASPRVKSGEVDPMALAPEAALRLMLDDPLLIRRPLMRVGERREVGFDPSVVDAWIGLAGERRVSEGCVRERKPEETT